MPIGEARDVLGRYRFSGDDVFKLVGDLSGGEQARIALAILALQGANLLILDEPTNHLDIPSQEVLQDVLSSFPGTLLIVTHDRYLINIMHAHVWALEDRTIMLFKEGYQAYRNWLTRRAESNSRDKDSRQSPAAREREGRRSAEREAQRTARRQAELEAAIHALEARLTRLEAQLAAASQEQAVESVTRLGAEYSEVEDKLNTLLAAWTDHAA
jgi:ATP-binding cassette subfamily F protein 3